MKPVKGDWTSIDFVEEDLGCLTFYYSSINSKVPTRAVDKNRDNKRDPNFETSTYGVFTSCNSKARRSCVREGRRYIFFMTNFNGVRQITGYYNLGWYCNISEVGSESVALKARSIHFVKEGIPFVGSNSGSITSSDIREGEIRSQGPPRGYCKLDNKSVEELLQLLKNKRNIANKYIQEVRRLENVNLNESGIYTYPSSHRRISFSNEDISEYLF